MKNTVQLMAAVLVCTLCSSCGTSATSTSSGADQNSSASLPAPPPSWTVVATTDKMSGAKQWFAESPAASPEDPMRFPYSDVQAYLNVGCDKHSEWTYFTFSTSPNLTHTRTHNGYSSVPTRIKWGSKITDVTLTQNWGSRFLSFDPGEGAVDRIPRHKTVLLELRWYGQGRVYFPFSLLGAKEAIQRIRGHCGMGPKVVKTAKGK